MLLLSANFDFHGWRYGPFHGFPLGVESRLATLTLDTNDLSKLSEISNRPDLPSTFQPDNISQLVTAVPALFNMLNIRRAIIPAANGHCSARALARYYATLVDGGVTPPPHSSFSEPPLGSHPHIPNFPFEKTSKKQKDKKNKDVASASMNEANDCDHKTNYCTDFKDGDNHRTRKSSTDSYARLVNDSSCSTSSASTPNIFASGDNSRKNDVITIFSNPKIHDAFLGVGEYGNLVMPNGKFGLGFRRFSSNDGSFAGFGHSGMGGSTGFCDIENRFAIAVTLNKMSFGDVTRKIIQFVCSELNIPLPEEFSVSGGRGPDAELSIGRPIIN